jgi:hypothetical protein
MIYMDKPTIRATQYLVKDYLRSKRNNIVRTSLEINHFLISCDSHPRGISDARAIRTTASLQIDTAYILDENGEISI